MCAISTPAADEALAACARSGCRDCFSGLYERYRMRMARYLHESFAVDFDTALDLEAEAWKRAYQHLGSCRGERPFKAWLIAITRNLALNHVRHAGRTPSPDAIVQAFEPAASPCDHLERKEAIEECIRWVRALSPELREPFVLRAIFDLDLKCVADLLGISATTARGRLFRARKMLAESAKVARR